jgi:hypothetical protein
VYLTPEERERVEALVPAVDALLGRLTADGVGDPIATLRAAVDAGPDAAEAPLLALARHVDLAALRWAPDVHAMLIIHNLADGVRLRLVMHACLDRIARVGVGVTRHP